VVEFVSLPAHEALQIPQARTRARNEAPVVAGAIA
jgi:hypothetical protein